MSPATRTALRTLTSTTGYYLLNDDISTPFGSSLLGKPVYVSDNMPDMEAGKTAIYYGDMKGLATKFAEEMEIEVLREKYATQHAVGVVGWLEFDGKIENDQMVKKLVMKA
jgi:HK97 family phage major capsid protein